MTRAGLAVGIVALVAGVLAPSLLSTPTPAPSASPRVAAASPGGTPGASDAPSQDPATTEWSDLALEPFEPLAELTAVDADRLGVALGGAFRLRSLTSIPAVDLAATLRSDPPVELIVKPGKNPDVAVVRPRSPLEPGVRYRFRMTATDGSLVGSWAFVARSPLRVAGTLPADRTTGVPPNTGIEITFDQDGPIGLQEHFSIEPRVAGRFEVHGRTWAFVPDRPLDPAVIYTVTVDSGVGVEGSTETLAEDVVFRFETGLADDRAPAVRFGREIIEVRPDTAPDIAVYVDDDARGGTPDAVKLLVHRLPSFGAVVDAAEALAGSDGWALASPAAVVDTTGLTRVARVDAPLIDSYAGPIMRVPTQLAPGFYVLTIEQSGAPAQAVVQVTDLSAYAMTASEDMVVWVNDLATDTPIPAATVSIPGGRELGVTATNGLLRVATPDSLGAPADAELAADDGEAPPPAARFLGVRAQDGRRLLVALGLPTAWAYRDGTSWWNHYPGDRDWWRTFTTDRVAYRQTDTIHVSGMIRSRADRSVPRTVEIRLRPQDGPPEAPILRVTATPSPRGVFTAALRLDDLPRSGYAVELYVGDDRISSLWVTITEIRKPAYRIDVETDRRVYVVGEEVDVTARATFYDGSPVPGMDLRFETFGDEVVVATRPDGTAHATVAATFDGDPTHHAYESAGVAPAHPEEGQISGDQWFLVLPSRAWLHAEGTVADGRIVTTGTLTRVDIGKLEAAIAAGDLDRDPSGTPMAGATIKAVVVRIIPIRREVGTTYDFIEKRVVPVYEYDERREQITSTTLTTAADGTFRLSLAAPEPSDTYVITLTATDGQGRRFVSEVYASPPRAARGVEGVRLPYLEVPSGCGSTPTVSTKLGRPVDVTLHAGDGSVPADGRLLFLVGRLGSLDPTIQDAATFVTTLRDADLPGVKVRAIWLANDGYFVADADVVVDPDERAISVTLRPDKSSYRPGGRVNLEVITTGPAGRPIAADVVLQGVDEKLYTMGLAQAIDPLGQLLEAPSPEFIDAYRSHAVPSPEDDGGCGDTGGGDRDDFRDTVTFQRITTDATGHGTASFDLSDDLTSWRMTAGAYSGSLEAGVGTVAIPVGLPFFVEAVLAPEYLVGDKPTLSVRGYGDAMNGGETVRFTVSAPSLGLEARTVEAAAFQPARVALPAMEPGDHRVRIEAEFRDGDRVRRDVLIRTVHVVSSRLLTLSTTFAVLDGGFAPAGGDGLTRFVVTDLGRGRLLGLLDELSAARSARFDRSVAAEMARAILIEDFDVPASSISETGYEAEPYQQSGIALLPYASPDLILSAKAALVANGRVDAAALRGSLLEWAHGGEGMAEPTREQSIIALAGLAGLGENVLAELRGFDVSELTIVERAWLALGLAAAGDEIAARSLERALLEEAGQRLGPWVRLLAPTKRQSLEASALLLLLSAQLGDPLSHDLARYIADNPSTEVVFPLEQIGYVQASLERLPRSQARFAWTVDGTRHVEALPAGGAFTLVLTRPQWSALALETLDGELGVATTLESSALELPHDRDLSIEKTVTPSSSASGDQLVKVWIRVAFRSGAPAGCYRLTDLLPSGLAPVVETAGWYDEEAEMNTIGPYDVEGQRVTWCASPDDTNHVYGYAARVVTPGTYRWEPTVLQWEAGPSVGASTEATTYVIR